MKTLSQTEVKQLLSEKTKTEPYKMVGHQWRHLTHIGKQYCTNCGIVLLNNEFTSWCVQRGCNHEDHPQYQSTMKRLTKPKWEK